MPSVKKIIIKETEKEIRKLLKVKVSNSFIGQRLRVLLILIQNEEIGISKEELAKLVGLDPNSIQNWRKLYSNTGIEGLMKHKKTAFKPSVFNAIEHQKLQTKRNVLIMDFKTMLSLKLGLKKKLTKF
ncbi:MAG: helix-turn-helix domain-containing protein [Flavobacterium sp.]|nr:helix-turn-helix domain-containing protein [Flavobacterium sp.]